MDENNVIEGILEKKEKNTSTNTKAPAGFIYMDGLNKKITVWHKYTFDKLVEKGKYKICYQTKVNEYGGRSFENNTLIDAIDLNLVVDKDNLTFTKEYIDHVRESGFPTDNLKEGSGEVLWKLAEFPVKINEEVKEIEMPQKVLDYLINLKSLVGSELSEELIYD